MKLDLKQMFNKEKNKKIILILQLHKCKKFMESGQGFVLYTNLLEILIFLTLQVDLKIYKTELVKSQGLIP